MPSPQSLREVQLHSFRHFLDHELPEIINQTEIPTRGGKVELYYDKDSDLDLWIPPRNTPEECIADGLTYQAQMYVKLTYVDSKTGETTAWCVQSLTPMPLMTERGTFIINGVERVLLSHLVRAPGVMFVQGERFRLRNLTKNDLATATLQPETGTWVRAELSQKLDSPPIISFRMSTRRSTRARRGSPSTTAPKPVGMFRLLSAIGLEDAFPGLSEALAGRFEFLRPQLEKEQASMTGTSEDDLLYVWKTTRPGSRQPDRIETARQWLAREYFGWDSTNLQRPAGEEGRCTLHLTGSGRHRVNAKLSGYLASVLEEIGIEGPGTPDEDCMVLTPTDILAVAVYLAGLYDDDPRCTLDDQEHFANRRIRTPGGQLADAMKSAMVTLKTPKQNIRGLPKAPKSDSDLRQIVRGREVEPELRRVLVSGRTSQRVDQINPLSSLSHLRRITTKGPGGIDTSRSRAPLEMRDVHFSHYGRMCPIETPEGPDIGLVGHLALMARHSDSGLLTAPYRTVENGMPSEEVVWLTAAEEKDLVIAQADSEVDADGRLCGTALCRRAPSGNKLSDLQAQAEGDHSYGTTSDVFLADPADVDLMDVSAAQAVSVPTSLIPFLEHDDPNRALMGANMSKQAVPLLVPEAPFVGTGMEPVAAEAAGSVLRAGAPGRVVSAEASGLVVRYRRPRLSTSKDPEKKRAYDEKALAKAPAGDIEIPLTSFGRSNDGTCVNWKPRVAAGDSFEEGDILADGPSTDNGDIALGKNLLTAYMSWGGYNFEDAIVVSERLVTDDVLSSVHLDTYEIIAKTTEHGDEEITGDNPSLSNKDLRHLGEDGIVRVGANVGPRAVLVSKITPKPPATDRPEQDLLEAIFGTKSAQVEDTSLRTPHGTSGRVVDIRTSFETDDEHDLDPGELAKIRITVAHRRPLSVGDKLAGRHGNKGVVSQILPAEDMPHLPDGTPIDIILSPMGVPSRMNIGQLLEASLGYAARFGWDSPDGPARGGEGKIAPKTTPAEYIAAPAFGRLSESDDSRDDSDIIAGLLERGPADAAGGTDRMVRPDGTCTLIDGRSGRPFDKPVTVGWTYILKLKHLADDKLHARSTGPVARASQQPTQGKSQFGGQRLGEMEVWALEAHGASNTLQEMLTYKSDDSAGSAAAHDAIVYGDHLPGPGRPETFNIMTNYLRSMALDVVPLRSEDGEDPAAYRLEMPSGQYTGDFRRNLGAIGSRRSESDGSTDPNNDSADEARETT